MIFAGEFVVKGCPEAMAAMPTGDVRLILSTHNTMQGNVQPRPRTALEV